MNYALAIGIVMLSVASAAAQTGQRGQSSTVVPSPFQSLGNIIRNPDAPPPPPPAVTSEPLRLPTAIPPNTVGTGSNRAGR
jgi:hypothetical protein